MNAGQDKQGTVHIRSSGRRAVLRVAVIFGALLAGAILLAAYPFIQMFRNGDGSPKLVLVFLLSMGICFFVAVLWLWKVASILDRLPYLTLTPSSLIYSGGKERVQLAWASMTVKRANQELFQVAVPAAAGPAGKTQAFDIPLDCFERLGTEIVRLLTERANAATLQGAMKQPAVSSQA